MNFNFNTPTNNSSTNYLNLKKNDVLDLSKVAPSLNSVILAAGWDVAETGPSFDLDISAFLLNDRGRVEKIPDDVIFFNHMSSRGIKLEGDNLTGDGDGDDERIDINLSQLDPRICKIVFMVTIFEAQSKHQTFGMVNNSYVRLLDADNGEREICRYELKDTYPTATAVTFAELSKENGKWSFKAIGEGSVGDLNTLIQRYV